MRNVHKRFAARMDAGPWYHIGPVALRPELPALGMLLHSSLFVLRCVNVSCGRWKSDDCERE